MVFLRCDTSTGLLDGTTLVRAQNRHLLHKFRAKPRHLSITCHRILLVLNYGIPDTAGF